MEKKIKVALLVAIATCVFIADRMVWVSVPLIPFKVVHHDGTGEHNLIEQEIDENDIRSLQVILDQIKRITE